jgi:hypothetical protein
MTTYPPKITFGEMRASGVRDVLIYCRDHRCNHRVEISAGRSPDDVRLSDIEPGFVCTGCGKRGAKVRPEFSLTQLDLSTLAPHLIQCRGDDRGEHQHEAKSGHCVLCDHGRERDPQRRRQHLPEA